MSKEPMNIKVGHTCVRVMRKDINDQGRETISKIHEGIVIQDCNTFVRVYSPAPVDKGGMFLPKRLKPILSMGVGCGASSFATELLSFRFRQCSVNGSRDNAQLALGRWRHPFAPPPIIFIDTQKTF